ncbi:hypothetical protein [Tepidibacter sp. Z1-5]|uniref:hypothetical protein n=1 Tax=Tepidibacter sp. Z1-5 TaxID=3134138 RepID=UPI0030BBF55F
MAIKIYRRKKGKRTLRTKENENTESYEIENYNLRTTADIGGLDRAKGRVEVIIRDLPEEKKDKKIVNYCKDIL